MDSSEGALPPMTHSGEALEGRGRPQKVWQLRCRISVPAELTTKKVGPQISTSPLPGNRGVVEPKEDQRFHQRANAEIISEVPIRFPNPAIRPVSAQEREPEEHLGHDKSQDKYGTVRI